MAKVQLVSSRDGAGTFAAGTTFYSPVATGIFFTEGTESRAEILWRTAVTLSGLWIRITANATTNSSTVRLRKNAADGNQTFSIGAGATGVFEDAVNTDSLSAGDKAAVSLAVGAGGTITVGMLSILVEPASGTINKFSNRDTTMPSTSGATRYMRLCGNDDETTLEAPAQFEFEQAGTLKNLYFNVRSNGRSVDSIVRVRLNGANTSITATVGAGATGDFEDSSNTAAVVAGDLVAFSCTNGASGSGFIRFNNLSIEFVSATDFTQLIAACGDTAGESLATSLTRYGCPAGRCDFAATTESNVQLEAKTSLTLSNLKVKVETNGITANTTIKTRVNGADGNQLLTIGSGVTGWVEDSSNTDDLQPGDLYNYQIVTGGTGTTIVLLTIGAKAEIISGAVPDDPSALAVTVDGADRVTVEWTDNSADETAFKVERAADSVQTGTVTTDGSDDVVGVGTSFTTACPAGTRIRIGTSATTYEVLSVTNDTNLVLTATAAAQSAVAFSKAGAFSVVHTTAADVESWQNTALAEQTRYWFQVYATNGAGDSDPTPELYALTRGYPDVSIDGPPDGATITPGVEIAFSATASDPDGYTFVDGDLEWTSDLDGLIGHGLNPSFVLSSGTHEITFTATDDDTDAGGDSIEVIVGTPSAAATVIRRPIMRYELVYGVAGTVDFWLSDADGNVIQPTLVAGDVKIAIDGGGAANVNTLPTPNNSDGFTWTYIAGEVTGKRIKVMVKDQTVPAAWVAEPLYILTIGDALAFYTEEILEVNSDGTAQVGGFSTAAKAEINAEVDTALTDYDAPTFSELDARTDAIQAVVDAISLVVDTEVAAIKAKTDNLPSDPADQSLLNSELSTILTRLGTPVGVDFSADIAAVQADTDNIQTRLPAALVSGRMDSSLAAAGLATDAVNEIRDAIFALTKDGLTFSQAVWLCAAVLAAKVSGGGTAEVTIRDVADTLDRVVADVDDNGNRTAVTLDLTGL